MSTDRSDFDHTADGTLITVGLRCWNNNLKLGTVTKLNSDGWHDFMEDGSDGYASNYNGERLVTRHPFTGEIAR